MKTNSKVYLRLNPNDNSFGTYFHGQEKCSNLYVQDGDVVGRVDLPTVLILGRSPCPVCVKPQAMMALRSNVIQNLKYAMGTAVGSVVEVTVDEAAVEAALEEQSKALAQEVVEDAPEEPEDDEGTDLGVSP